MSKIRAGLVGLGVMGKHHFRVLDDDENFDLVGIHDPNLNQGSHRGVKNFDKLSLLLQLGLDYCVISVPTNHHSNIFDEVTKLCKCVLVEKPIASNSDEAQRMIDLSKSRIILAGVGHVERFNPAIQLMRNLIQQDHVGEIIQITTRRQGPFPQRIQDVGVIKDLATHDIDITQWVTSSKYSEISAYSRTMPGSSNEDLLSASGILESGALFNHVVNWRYPVKERVVSILGTKGALVADLLTSDVTYFENGLEPTSWGQMSLLRGNAEGSAIKFAVNKIEPLQTEHNAMRDFLLSGNSQDVVTLEQGLENIKVAERMISTLRN